MGCRLRLFQLEVVRKLVETEKRKVGTLTQGRAVLWSIKQYFYLMYPYDHQGDTRSQRPSHVEMDDLSVSNRMPFQMAVAPAGADVLADRR